MENKQNSDHILIDRRNLIKGGIAAAATVPWIAGSSAIAQSQSIYASAGQRVLVLDNHQVLGLGAYSISIARTAQVRNPTEDILAGQIHNPEDKFDAVARLLQVSLIHNNNQNDNQDVNLLNPRTVDLQDHIRNHVTNIFEVEQELHNLLNNSHVFWVSTNPTFLYVIGSGVVLSLIPFVNRMSISLSIDIEFEFNPLKIFRWLLNQINR